MENIVNSKEYKAYRERIEKYFVEKNLTKTEYCNYGEYSLVIGYYSTGENTWDFTRCLLFKQFKVIADIKRNYSPFIFDMIKHKNGNVYFVCGEDYQGYTIVNCTEETMQTFIPDGWFNGWGLCWTSINDDFGNCNLCKFDDISVKEMNDESDTITVDCCYWGGDSERAIYDFSNPDILPLKEIDRYSIDDGDE